MTGKGFRLPERRDGWDFGKEFLGLRVLRPWHRVPREAVAAPGSLEVPKARLDGAWSSLGQWKVSLPMAREKILWGQQRQLFIFFSVKNEIKTTPEVSDSAWRLRYLGAGLVLIPKVFRDCHTLQAVLCVWFVDSDASWNWQMSQDLIFQ